MLLTLPDKFMRHRRPMVFEEPFWVDLLPEDDYDQMDLYGMYQEYGSDLDIYMSGSQGGAML